MTMPVVLIMVYAVLVLSPFMALALGGGLSTHFNLTAEIGRCLGLTGFMILMMQVVLAGRFKAITRHFGLDIVLRYHRHMAMAALVFVVAHPILLAWGNGAWNLLYSLNWPWYILVGKLSLVLVLINVMVSKYQRRLNMTYEWWRVFHDFAGLFILVGIFLHSWFTGSDFHLWSLRVLWVVAFGAAILLFCYHRLIRPLRLRQRSYRVVEITPETDNVWTVKIQPPSGEKAYDHLPGQFHFLTFDSAGGVPREEHHFTISSSPTVSDYRTSTIKALGDFTSRIGQLSPGDLVAVHAAFGRFSYLLHPDEKELVFVTGGIGVTPVMSMLRHMRDTKSERPVTFFYANPSWETIVYRTELEEMAAEGRPRLTMVHILEHPPEGWTGETGRLDEDMLTRHLSGDIRDKGYYLCGPPGLVNAAVSILKKAGVPDHRLHTEIFSFLD
jgi:predicted ferric reductase